MLWLQWNCFKCVFILYWPVDDAGPIMNSCPGNFQKFIKNHYRCNTRLQFFSQRVINRWNSLSEEHISVSSVNSFKHHLRWNSLKTHSLQVLLAARVQTSDSFGQDEEGHLCQINLCHCQFVLMRLSIHSFLGPLPTGIPFHWLFASRSRFSLSMEVCWAQHPPIIADHHDTPAVTGGLHPLLDTSPKNRRALQPLS